MISVTNTQHLLEFTNLSFFSSREKNRDAREREWESLCLCLCLCNVYMCVWGGELAVRKSGEVSWKRLPISVLYAISLELGICILSHLSFWRIRYSILLLNLLLLFNVNVSPKKPRNDVLLYLNIMMAISWTNLILTPIFNTSTVPAGSLQNTTFQNFINIFLFANSNVPLLIFKCIIKQK